MTFDAGCYVPVLKLKRAEKAALLMLPPASCQRIIPFFEVVKRSLSKGVDVAGHIDIAFRDLPAVAAKFKRVFIDAREMESDGEPAASAVFSRAKAEGISFIPVTGISRTFDVSAALSNSANGLCLRLTRDEFESGHLGSRIRGFLTRHGLQPSSVDLIVDLGPVDDMELPGVIRFAREFLKDVPDRTTWRTLTISACAFPKSMGVVDKDSWTTVSRNDWVAWRDYLYAFRSKIDRLPTYSDCAIQHTTGVEDFDWRTMSSSAAIRYACGDNWLLIKGVSTKLIRPSLQYPGLSQILVAGSCSSYFRGASHCQGCEQMVDASRGADRLGSQEVWRKLGTIHHIVTVTDGIGSLHVP